MRSMAKLQDDLKATERAHQAWNDENVQWLVQFMNEDLDFLSDAPMRKSLRTDEKIVRALKNMGLDRPTTHEDELRLYCAIKAVVGYWTAKLSTLEAQSQKHVTTKERIHELGTNGGIRNHGSAPVR